MHKLALIGKCLSHSKSKEVYEKILGKSISYSYLEYQKSESIPKLNDLFEEFDGVSVTAPYKNDVFNMVKTAKEIKELAAVNCIKVQNNEIVGTNTDYLASIEILKAYKQESINLILIIGDGSMSNVIQKVCKECNLKFDVTSRKIDKFTLLKQNISNYSLVINTCAREFDFSSITYVEKQMLWDLNYDQSYLVRIKERYSHLYSDGKELLELQAKFACNYWEI